MKKLLLHICCAPCGTYISRERLAPSYDLTWYFYNPNLVSLEEYERRLHYVKLMAEKFGWPLIIEPYDHVGWREKIRGRENDPEKGERCLICYRDRLEKTARYAKANGFDLFGTTLLVSPYKDTAAIRAIGRELAAAEGVAFLDDDFQTDDGYRRSQELARELGIYRQKFCGCEYSLNQRPSRVSPSQVKAVGALILILMMSFLAVTKNVLAQTATSTTTPTVVSTTTAAMTTAASTTLDSDNDGYPDAQEIKNNYSPYNPQPVKLDKSDADKDGLSDYWELKFGTDPLNPDSDGDGYSDGQEVDMAHDPLSSSTKKLPQKITINLKKQQLTYFVAGQPWKVFTVSTGKAAMPTPKGDFHVVNKNLKAWSNTYKLWMPYWLGLDKGEFGIHELPLWPDGYREGQDHLGKPVSHGCIRLGIGPAQYLYDRVGTGTEVIIK